MDQKVHRLVKRSLNHLCEEHREEALDLLIVLGLKHYQLLYTDQAVHLPILEYLCGKYVDDLAKAPAGKRTPASNKDVQHSTATSLGNRQYRQDSMAHYPFADDSGTVTDVLHVESSDLQKLLEMGEPACKRLVIRIFEEMRFSKVGLKMSDVPEALSRLGLTVSPALRKILERTDPDTFNKKISNTNKNHRHSSYTESDLTVSFLTLAQFTRVVKRLIYLHRSGMNPDDIVHLFGHAEEGLGRDTDVFGSDVDRNSGSVDGQSDGEWEREAKRAHPEEENEAENEVESALDQARTTRMSQRRHHQATSNTTSSARKGTEQEQFLRGLKHVSSKIAPIISFDRRRHQQAAQKTTKAALRTVAQRRVDALVSTAVPVGFKDRHHFTEPQLFHSKPTVHSGRMADRVLSKTTPVSSHGYNHVSNHTHSQGYTGNKGSQGSNSGYKRYADLSTGLATMEIADAFLQGEIGREMLSTPESDYRSFPDEELLNPGSAQRTAAVLLGLPTHSTNSANDTNHTNNTHSATFPSRMYPSSPSNGDARFAPNAAYHNPNPNHTYSGQSVHTSNSVNARDHTYTHNNPNHTNNYNTNNSITTNSITGAALGGNGAGAMHVSHYATSQADYRLNQYGQQAANTNINTNTNPNYTTDFGHLSLQSKRTDQHLNNIAKRLYEAPGWRSAQGGWVADFGPPHTHALYTGPEVNYTTIAHDSAMNRRIKADRAASQGPLIPPTAADDEDYQYESGVKRDTATVTSTYKQRQDNAQDHTNHNYTNTNNTNTTTSTDTERHVQRALHSASRQNTLLEAQYRANEEEIDDMIKRTNRELSGFGGGGLSTSFSSSAVAFDAATSGNVTNSGGGAAAAARRSYEQQQPPHQHHLDHEGVQVVKQTTTTTSSTVRRSFWDDHLGDDDEAEEGILSVDTAVAGAGAGALRELAHKTHTTRTISTIATSAAAASSSHAQGLGAGIAAPATTSVFEEGSDSSDGFDFAHNPYTFGEGFGESSEDSVNLNDSMSLSAAARNM